LADAGFRITAGENGEKLFASKGCVECHKNQSPASGNLTLTGVAAAMWNHATMLHAEPPHLSEDEMRDMLGSWWAKQFFQGTGDPSKGKKIFAAKHCGECHSGTGPGQNLTAMNGSYNAITTVSALWRHGPAMLDEMQKKHIAWPTFKGEEMANLIAWLNEGSKK
jgi:cytochrome c551/c552